MEEKSEGKRDKVEERIVRVKDKIQKRRIKGDER